MERKQESVLKVGGEKEIAMLKGVLLETTFAKDVERSVWCVHITYSFGFPRDCFHVTCERKAGDLATSVTRCDKEEGHYWVELPADVESAVRPILDEKRRKVSMDDVMV